ncbi:Uncharacterised protein [Vibrio cholerae]|nr:Uncharacterised protein [Vibrio cholerae]CSI17869.1 Uncharacterised protein [Vibrio cholerae]
MKRATYILRWMWQSSTTCPSWQPTKWCSSLKSRLKPTKSESRFTMVIRWKIHAVRKITVRSSICAAKRRCVSCLQTFQKR